MSVRPIVEYPHQALLQPAASVQKFDDALRILAKDLLDTLEQSTGIGLSAPQLGESAQVLVISEPTLDEGPLVVVNPTILRTAVPCIVEERCLSLPGLSGHVLRSAEAEIAYQTLDGTAVQRTLSGMAAVCLQHEVDHLQGQLFLERLSRFKQWRYRRRLRLEKTATAA